MTTTSVLNTMFGYDPSGATTDPQEQESIDERAVGRARSFGKEQMRSLVQRLFFQGGPKSPRQVVFSCVDNKTDVGKVCLKVGHALSAQASGSVCIVETASQPRCDEEAFQREPGPPTSIVEGLDWLRDSALQLSKKLWLVPPDVFLRNEKALSAVWLRRRLDELRLAFDYTIFHAPPAGQSSDPLLLGHLCDGVVLVLTAGSTRRVAARKAKERLYSANAPLLGTVLSDRKFPIPERIYRRL
jgi:hypothetical protein